jgi:hypothetical protein
MGFSELFDSQKGRTVHTNRTICELHRELYDLCVMGLHDKDPELMKQMIKVLEDAFIMGVKMNKKLCKYKLGTSSKWDKKEYRNEDVSRDEIIERRKKRKKLVQILEHNDEILKKFNKNKG